MKKKLFTTIITAATLTFASCQPVSASETEIFTDGSEITSVQSTTESGMLYTFSDGSKYFQDGSEYAIGGYTPASENDYELDNIDNMYPLTGIVTNLKLNAKPGEDLVTITCTNGNMFSWYAPTTDCWDLYDLASCIMDSNGTKYVDDDEVILAYYAGGLNQFEKLIKYN